MISTSATPVKVTGVGLAEGTLSGCDSHPGIIRPETSAAIATVGGSRMAKSELKTMSGTTAAASSAPPRRLRFSTIVTPPGAVPCVVNRWQQSRRSPSSGGAAGVIWLFAAARPAARRLLGPAAAKELGSPGR